MKSDKPLDVWLGHYNVAVEELERRSRRPCCAAGFLAFIELGVTVSSSVS